MPSGIVAALAPFGAGLGPAQVASASDAQAVNNEFLNPTGTPTPHEQVRQNFVIKLKGFFTVGLGRTTTQAQMVFLKFQDGTSPYSLHVYGKMGLVTLKDPTAPITGSTTVFDKDINSNTVIGLDLTGNPQDVDRHGRPTLLNFVTDVNISSGIFVEAVSQGTVKIQYSPGGRHPGGTFSNGQAVVVVRGTAYTLGTSNVIRVPSSR
jgi:hypothetical protein